MCLRVWKGGFEINNSNKMVAKEALVITNITHIVKVVDARKMVKSQHEATINLFMLVTFLTFAAFSSHPTISKE